MMKRFASLCMAAALLAAAPAHAQRAEGWQAWKTGDFAVSPMMLGPEILIGNGANATLFGLFTDFDYHLYGPAAVGAFLNLGFGDNLVGLDIGPQFKYKFNVGGTSHSPYFRAGMPIRFLFPSEGRTGVGLGLFMFGGGYKYFFHRMVGAGIEINFTPTVFFTPNVDFVFGINIQFGIEIKL
jgi:hypothetical protein